MVQSMGNDRSPVKRLWGMILEIGDRLKEERLRLGMTQVQLAAELGIAKKSQTNYELGNSSPSADYLAALAAVGVDVGYVLTGKPSAALSNIESELLRRFRAASTDVRAAVMAGLGAAAAASADGPSFTVHGDNNGQQVAGDLHQRDVTFNVGGKKRGIRE